MNYRLQPNRFDQLKRNVELSELETAFGVQLPEPDIIKDMVLFDRGCTPVSLGYENHKKFDLNKLMANKFLQAMIISGLVYYFVVA